MPVLSQGVDISFSGSKLQDLLKLGKAKKSIFFSSFVVVREILKRDQILCLFFIVVAVETLYMHTKPPFLYL